MRLFPGWLRLVGVPLVALAVSGCGDDTSGPVEPEISASSLSIIIEVGESRNLGITRVPAGAAFEAESESPLVATVSKSASTITITGVCEGFIAVTLTMPAYPWVRTIVTVEVTDDDPEPAICGN
jgi:hypothetical protein